MLAGVRHKDMPFPWERYDKMNMKSFVFYNKKHLKSHKKELFGK